MIWMYIFAAVMFGLIAGFGYYLVTKDSFNMNEELNTLVAELKGVKKRALVIGVLCGVFWVITVFVVAIALVVMACMGKSMEEIENSAGTMHNVDLTNHNIVLDEAPKDTIEVDLTDEQAAWIDLNAETEVNKEPSTEK